MKVDLLAIGAPTPAGAPNLGPWIHFFWVVLILALIIFVVWWGWGQIGPKIPEPLRTIVFVIGIFLLVVAIIYFILIPLMGVF
jgi:hypothetical protein